VQYAQGWFLARPAAPELVIPMLSSSPEPPAVVLTEP
jgi:hypothetical protein